LWRLPNPASAAAHKAGKSPASGVIINSYYMNVIAYKFIAMDIAQDYTRRCLSPECSSIGVFTNGVGSLN
jgi:hypothetical protein